jgi:hypothetical protein
VPLEYAGYLFVSSTSSILWICKAVRYQKAISVGGAITINALDDALHSNATLTINGGSLDVTESYEGLESQIVTINDGKIHLIASDDSIDATDGVVIRWAAVWAISRQAMSTSTVTISTWTPAGMGWIRMGISN